MKPGMLALALVFSGCSQEAAQIALGTGYPDPPAERPMEVAQRVSTSEQPVTDGWRQGEVLVRGGQAVAGGYLPDAYRKGITPEGLPYQYFADSSGAIGDLVSRDDGWNLSCRKDKMTDVVTCWATHRKTGLMVFAEHGKPVTACISQHDFPGRNAGLRLDENPQIDMGRTGCQPWTRVTAVASAKTVTTRHFTFPWDRPRDLQGRLDGVSSAIDLAAFLSTHHGKLPF